jgi:hypothetical protein
MNQVIKAFTCIVIGLCVLSVGAERSNRELAYRDADAVSQRLAINTFARGIDRAVVAPYEQTASTGDRFMHVQYQQVVRCVTPQGICWLQGYAPPGAPCWCATPYEPVAGQVRSGQVRSGRMIGICFEFTPRDGPRAQPFAIRGRKNDRRHMHPSTQATDSRTSSPGRLRALGVINLLGERLLFRGGFRWN